MFAKVKDGAVEVFPYDITTLVLENRNVSFPKGFPDDVINSYDIFRVAEAEKPEFDPLTQDCVINDAPHLEGSKWVIGYTAQNKHVDIASKEVRRHRNALLKNTDWVVVFHTERGTSVPIEWKQYRQALRDITDQPGFPHAVIWPDTPVP